MITYTCGCCLNDVPFVYKPNDLHDYQAALCSRCYQRAGYTLTVGEWAAEMKASNPDNPKAWND